MTAWFTPKNHVKCWEKLDLVYMVDGSNFMFSSAGYQRWVHSLGGQIRPVRTSSKFNPHQSHTSIHFVQNWINPLRLCLHYELKLMMILYARPNHGHMIAYLPLAAKQSCFWISHLAGFGHCLIPVHTTTRLFLVQSDDCLTSTNTYFN